MDDTACFPWAPLVLSPESCPDIDLCRPPFCPRCGHVSHDGVRLWIWGHGRRKRDVVVLPLGWSASARLATAWARRFLCRACSTTFTVLPQGLVSRYLYSAWAVVVAWFLVEGRPVGEGLGDADAYRRQGMYEHRDWTEASPYRWRSIRRWRAALTRRWPVLAMGISGWLVSLRERIPSPDLRAIVAGAIAHLGCGPSG